MRCPRRCLCSTGRQWERQWSRADRQEGKEKVVVLFTETEKKERQEERKASHSLGSELLLVVAAEC